MLRSRAKPASRLQTAEDLQRGKPGGFVPAKIVEASSARRRARRRAPKAEKQTERYRLPGDRRLDPPFEAGTPQGKAINDTLQNSYADDLVSEYIGRLENDFGVNVNPAGAESGHRRRHPTITYRPCRLSRRKAAFAERYGRGEAQVVWTTLVADLETPVSAFLKLGGGKAMSFLLESVEGGAVRGRYSIIGLEPDLIWRTTAQRPRSTARPARKPTRSTPCTEPPLQALAHADRGKPHRLCPMACRRCRPAYSAISATTWCG